MHITSLLPQRESTNVIRLP